MKLLKKTRVLKRFVALILIILLSIDSFSAVVGDNDGSAFITKGEFDSLRNDFQNQINHYNMSLDNKIDGAIAAYIAGVHIQDTWAIKTLFNGFNVPMISSKKK